VLLVFGVMSLGPGTQSLGVEHLRASFSFLTDRLSYLLTNRLRQVAFPVTLSVKKLLTVTTRLTITVGYLTDG